MSLQAIKYKRGKLEILDQVLLPWKSEYIRINGVEDGWNVINKMQVRGAPAIAIVGCLSLAIELNETSYEDKMSLLNVVKNKLTYLVSARPTAVNLNKARTEVLKVVENIQNSEILSLKEMKEILIKNIEAMLDKDIDDNKAIGSNGAEAIIVTCLSNNPNSNKPLCILTHCNTGSLATAGYGTALGVIRKLHSRGQLSHVFCTETRPYNQGARLTAYELVYENIPATLVCDDMVAALMKSGKVSAVIVGADRVAKNGDTANKIGTYQIAVLAAYHKIVFYVAAPMTSIDFSIPNGDHIIIEERPEKEMTFIGSQPIAAPGIKCWNPAFDVTPASLITGIITESGVYNPIDIASLNPLCCA